MRNRLDGFQRKRPATSKIPAATGGGEQRRWCGSAGGGQLRFAWLEQRRFQGELGLCRCGGEDRRLAEDRTVRWWRDSDGNSSFCVVTGAGRREVAAPMVVEMRAAIDGWLMDIEDEWGMQMMEKDGGEREKARGGI